MSYRLKTGIAARGLRYLTASTSLAAALLLTNSVCAQEAGAPSVLVPSEATISANRAVVQALPFGESVRDIEDARRGFIADRKDPEIRTKDGLLVWDLSAMDFTEAEPPSTVNPSLWRNAKLYGMTGLFRVSDNVYQVRGFDLANVTYVRGDTGWIVIDPLLTAETAEAAFELLKEHIEDAPVSAMIYTHSHGDHFGGSIGMMPFADEDIPIIAPAGFMEEVISENVIAGPVMQRRATYQFGSLLGLSPKASLGSGMAVSLSKGTTGLVPPNTIVEHTGDMLIVDGVKMEFQITSGTEAPSEFNIGMPELGVINIAENATSGQHNMLTPRGAKVRDSHLWAQSLTEAMRMFDYADSLTVSHGWPVFGQAEVQDYLANQRDAYAFLHDQTVRLMNKGFTPEEIADNLKLPEGLARHWYNRPYYGDFRFNVRAVYQFYLGWFDGNPVHLAPFPPEEAGSRYVAAMGGPDAVIDMAKTAYDEGEYQWASELLNRLVFSDATNTVAKELLADTYTQMGWQEENALWRNFYLTGAKELRNGPQEPARADDGPASTILAEIPTAKLFDVLATNLDPGKAGDLQLKLALIFPDTSEEVLLSIRNGVMIHEDQIGNSDVAATLTINKADFIASMGNPAAVAQKLGSGEATLTGDLMSFATFGGLFDQPDPSFAIVTP